MFDISKLNDNLGFTKEIAVTDYGVLHLPGKQADYRIKIIDQTLQRIEVTDLTKINLAETKEFDRVKSFHFDDVRDFEIATKLPYHFQDIIDVAAPSLSPYLIEPTTLLANDQDYHGLNITISQVYKPRGGEVVLNNNGMIEFTPEPRFNCVMHFHYQIKNSDGEVNLRDVPVYLRTADLPKETEFVNQWYLTHANVIPVWKDYTGKGIDVAVYDTGFLPPHPDIVANLKYRTSAHFQSTLSQHALNVAGVIGAARNGNFLVGVAYDADLHSVQAPIFFNDGVSKNNLDFFKDYDIINNSWGQSLPLYPSVDHDSFTSALIQATKEGRKKHGSVIVFASGNNQAEKQDANYASWTNNPYVITVGGIDKPTDLAFTNKLPKPFATAGEVILVSAADSNMLVLTTNQLHFDQDWKFQFNPITVEAEGTSFAAPLVSSIVALMLEANPNLGWRDVQQILAVSAKGIANIDAKWGNNAAKHWNEGGMHFSHQYGFGNVDALAAVRLSETWLPTKIADKDYLKSSFTPGTIIKETNPKIDGNFKYSIAINQEIQLEFVTIAITGDKPGFFANKNISLTSPAGTTSIVLTQDMNDEGSYSGTNKWDFSSVKFRGESGLGNWVLSIEEKPQAVDPAIPKKQLEAMKASLTFFNIKLFGKAQETQIFITNEITSSNKTEKEITGTKEECSNSQKTCSENQDGMSSILGKEGKQQFDQRCSLLRDKCAELLTNNLLIPNSASIFNAAAVTHDLKLNLKSGVLNIDDKNMSFAIENKLSTIITGDGDDSIIGNDQPLDYMPGRGNDKIILGKGASKISYIWVNNNIGHDIIYGFDHNKDKLSFTTNDRTIAELTIREHLVGNTSPSCNTTNSTSPDWSINLIGVDLTQLTAENIIVAYK